MTSVFFLVLLFFLQQCHVVLLLFSRGPDFDTNLFGESGITVRKLLEELYEKVCYFAEDCVQNVKTCTLLLDPSIHTRESSYQFCFLCTLHDTVPATKWKLNWITQGKSILNFEVSCLLYLILVILGKDLRALVKLVRKLSNYALNMFILVNKPLILLPLSFMN